MKLNKVSEFKQADVPGRDLCDLSSSGTLFDNAELKDFAQMAQHGRTEQPDKVLFSFVM